MGHKGWLNEAISNRAAVIRQPLSNLENIFSRSRHFQYFLLESIGNQFGSLPLGNIWPLVKKYLKLIHQ